MAIPKELRRKVDAYKEAYNSYLGEDEASTEYRHMEKMLEAELGRSGVRSPSHVLSNAREEVKQARIDERKRLKRLQQTA